MSESDPPRDKQERTEPVGGDEPDHANVGDLTVEYLDLDTGLTVLRTADGAVLRFALKGSPSPAEGAAMEKPPARSPARGQYATIPLRDKAEVVRRDALRERAEAALRKHRKPPAR